jgi:predicted nucleic acid-binding protein
MKIIDTVVLISSLDPEHPLYRDAIKHLQSVIFSEEIYVPSVVLIECDLVLKAKGFSKEERSIIFERLTQLIPENRILPITINVLKRIADLENEKRYFDALIASTALEHNADIISTDHVFPKEGITTLW